MTGDNSDLPPAPIRAGDGLAGLKRFTPARIGLGRPGAALPTGDALKFGRDHARARDAVHVPLDFDALEAELAKAELDAPGLASIRVHSAARDRTEYLRRPDLGRRLSPDSRAQLQSTDASADIVLVAADGLSSRAVADNGPPLVARLVPLLRERGHSLGPIVLVAQGRVAIGDEIGEVLGARLVVMLIGERPGLSAADSLGAYLTFAPHVGCSDSMRNCISNIRAAGLSVADAATEIGALADAALAHQLTGVTLNRALTAARQIGGS
ncbi:MAG: ethanolamine ammonia-lyase subunit EutC [Ancalomicrobiaceae bacterium]|nr:ethanolamine ammonia-lyase subunit EutC [Ancalomicrobiaceae bacterium]